MHTFSSPRGIVLYPPPPPPQTMMNLHLLVRYSYECHLAAPPVSSQSSRPVTRPYNIHLEQVCMIARHTETRCGNKFILTVTDYFLKWAEAGPLPSKSEHGVASKVFVFNKFVVYITKFLQSLYSCYWFF